MKTRTLETIESQRTKEDKTREREREGEGDGKGEGERENVSYYKEEVHTIIEAGKPKICRVSQQARDLGQLMFQTKSKGQQASVKRGRANVVDEVQTQSALLLLEGGQSFCSI